MKSFSMAMGIRRPGFQLLSLTSTIPSFEALTQLPNSSLDTPCFLPDQLGIYLNIYIPFTILSLLSLLAFNIHRTHTRNNKQQQRRSVVSPRSSYPDYSASRATSEYELSRRLLGRCNTEDTDEDPLPPPVTKPGKLACSSKLRGRLSSCSWVFYCLGRRRRIAVSLPCSRIDRGVGLLRGFLGDVLDVAWPPVLVFCVAAWWAVYF